MLFAAVVLERSEFERQMEMVVQEIVQFGRSKVLRVEIAKSFVEADGFDEFGCTDGGAAEVGLNTYCFSGIVGCLGDTGE